MIVEELTWRTCANLGNNISHNHLPQASLSEALDTLDIAPECVCVYLLKQNPVSFSHAH